MTPELKLTVLIDNTTRSELLSEWGLSFYIEYRGKKLLLDTGASGAFAENAEQLGIDLEDVDYGILSHAHYDHADGIDTFFEKNQKADFFLREGTKENCFGGLHEPRHYIGIRRGVLQDHADRIRFVSGDFELMTGAYLIPHKTEGLAESGVRAGMYRYDHWHWIPDDFSHEQSLVLETEKGLVVFNSCSHGGADNIVREVMETLPGRPVAALIGGFHLYETPAGEVREFAGRLRETGVQEVITGHCTGEEAFQLLKEEQGLRAEQMYAGFQWEI